MRQDFIIKINLPEMKTLSDNECQNEFKMYVSKDKVDFRSKKNRSDKMHYSSLKAWDANGKILENTGI